MKSELDSDWGFEIGGIRWRRIAVLGIFVSALVVTAIESRSEEACSTKPKELSKYMICIDEGKNIKVFPRFGSTTYEIRNATLVLATEEKIYFYRTDEKDGSLISNFSLDPQTGEETCYGKHRR